jgi:hypothetical protein
VYQPERDGEEETEAEPEADLVMKMDPETLGDGVLDRDEDDDMDTWGEFENALLGVSRGVLEPVMEVDDDEEMDGDTVPVTLSEPVEELVWEGDSLLVTMDDEVTEIVATGEVVESELQVAVLVRVKVGEFE